MPPRRRDRNGISVANTRSPEPGSGSVVSGGRFAGGARNLLLLLPMLGLGLWRRRLG